MNLSAYDKINSAQSKTKIYNDNNSPYIITREVKKRKYYCYVTRYEPKLNENIIYLVLLDDKPNDRQVARTRVDTYGRLKFNLSQIRSVVNISPSQSYNINIALETAADDGDVYKLMIE